MTKIKSKKAHKKNEEIKWIESSLITIRKNSGNKEIMRLSLKRKKNRIAFEVRKINNNLQFTQLYWF
jgi:hypothetical protein